MNKVYRIWVAADRIGFDMQSIEAAKPGKRAVSRACRRAILGLLWIALI